MFPSKDGGTKRGFCDGTKLVAVVHSRWLAICICQITWLTVNCCRKKEHQSESSVSNRIIMRRSFITALLAVWHCTWFCQMERDNVYGHADKQVGHAARGTLVKGLD